MNKHIRKKINLLNNDDGATSILVIFMMIVLVTLGAFALTSANVNLKFSRKANNLSSIYYQLDNKGEDYLKNIDINLSLAETQAVEYIINEGYLETKNDQLPDILQKDINTFYLSNLKNDETINSIINKVYLYYSNESLNALSAKYPEQEVNAGTDDDIITSISSSLDLIIDDSINSYLQIGVDVEPIKYKISFNNGDVYGEKDLSYPRYLISSWNQGQEFFEVETSDEPLWDGSVK